MASTRLNIKAMLNLVARLVVLCFVMTSNMFSQDTIRHQLQSDLDSFQIVRKLNPEFAKNTFLDNWQDSLLNCAESTSLNNKIGVYYWTIGDYKKTIEYFEDSTLFFQKKCLPVEDPKFAKSYFNIANTYNKKLLDSRKAKEYFLKCVEHLEEYSMQTCPKSAFYFYFVSQFFKDCGDYQRAIYYWQKSISFDTYISDVISFANLNNEIGLIYLKIENSKLALNYFNIGLSAIDDNINSNEYYRLMDGKLRALLMLRDFDNAQKLLNIVIPLLEKSNNVSLLTSSYINQARIYARTNESDKALELCDLNKSLDSSSFSIAVSFDNSGDVYFFSKNYTKALESYENALKYLTKDHSANEIFNFENLKESYKIPVLKEYGYISRANYFIGEKSNYVASLENSTIMDSLSWIHFSDAFLDNSIQIGIRNNIKNYSYGVASGIILIDSFGLESIKEDIYRLMNSPKAYLLRANLNRSINYQTVLPDSLYEVYSQLRSQKEKASSMLAQTNGEISEDSLKVLQDKLYMSFRNIDKFKSKIEAAYPELNDQSLREVKTLKEVQLSLTDNELQIEYFYTKDFLFRVDISKDEAQFYQFDKSIFDIWDENATLSKESDNWLTYLTELNNTFLPAASTLDKYNKLIIIPDGPLVQFPFESFVSSSGDFLVDKYDISYKYSNVDIIKPDGGNDELLLMGSDYNESISSFYNSRDFSWKGDFVIDEIPMALDEVKSIGKRLGVNAIKNESATKQLFKEKAENSKLIHLAMHGFLNEQFPDQSGIVFSPEAGNDDVFMSAAEIYNLNLNNDLTVLSSCHSGEGKYRAADAPRSLARSFLAAGSKTVLMSLWEASDASTAKITADFYQGLSEDKKPSVALADAKRKYLQEAHPSQRHPKYWAHLVLVGQDNVIDLGGGGVPVYVWILGGLLLLGLCYFVIRKSK